MLNEQAKKTILRKMPHGLYVCGVKDGEDVNGFTVSWLMQASFKPPLVVSCVKQDSKSHEMIKNSGVFAISFLDENQKDIAQKFFQPQRRVGRDRRVDGISTGFHHVQGNLRGERLARRRHAMARNHL